jgi:purine-binding chemotaxis protein CheW
MKTMYLDKTQCESSLELNLYIEGLLRLDDVQAEVQLETKEIKDIEIKSPVPDWGQMPFECLLVKAAGMNFMLPAMSVAYIERINKKIIRLPLDVDAFLGVITLREKSIAVIDLFGLIAENKIDKNENSMQVNSNHIEYVIVMENSGFALACDDIGQIVKLDTDDVRWNRASFNNPMYTGIVMEHLCPIVNIDYLNQQVAAMPFVQSLNEGND